MNINRKKQRQSTPNKGDHHLPIAFNEPEDYLLSEDFCKELSECGGPFLLFEEHSQVSAFIHLENCTSSC